MTTATTFAARTDLLCKIDARLARLLDRRAGLIQEFAAIRSVIETRHRRGELATDGISDLQIYYKGIRKIDEEAAKLLLEASQTLSGRPSGE